MGISVKGRVADENKSGRIMLDVYTRSTRFPGLVP